MFKIKVTEENFEKILERILRYTNKYRMFEFYRVYDDETNTLKHKVNPFGIKYDIKYIDKENGDFEYKKKYKFYYFDKYVKSTKHRFREEYETNPDSWDAKHFYSESHNKPLIHLDTSGCTALVISNNTEIKFLPFHLGFIIYDTNDDIRIHDEKRTIYKHTFVPNIFNGKIKDIAEEDEKRYKEWEEYCDYYNQDWKNQFREYVDELYD